MPAAASCDLQCTLPCPAFAVTRCAKIARVTTGHITRAYSEALRSLFIFAPQPIASLNSPLRHPYDLSNAMAANDYYKGQQQQQQYYPPAGLSAPPGRQSPAIFGLTSFLSGGPQQQQGGYYPQVRLTWLPLSNFFSNIKFQQPQNSYQQGGYQGQPQYQGPPQGYPQQGYQPNPGPQTVYV